VNTLGSSSSSITSSYYGRITGLVSGLDTDSIVSQMVRAQSYRLNEYLKEKQRIQWKQEAYRNINLDLANFIVNTKKNFELTKSVNGTSLNSSIDSATWLKKVTNSNTDVLTATAKGNAVAGTYTVNVTKLAKGVQAVSGANILAKAEDGSISKALTSTKLCELEGVTFGAEDSIDNLYINGKKIEGLTGNSTIKDLINKVNSSGAGVTMSYDSTIGRFFISSNTTGAENAKLQITGDGANAALDGASAAGELVTALKLSITRGDGTQVAFNSATTLADLASASNIGQDAVYDFAGATGLTSATNTVTINGISMTFIKEGSSTVTVETDIDTIISKVKSFFEEDYNGLIDKLYTKLNEKVYRDYEPLLDEQKNEMKDSDIEKWEAMSKSGLLRNDSIITSMISSIREAIYRNVEGEGIDPNYNALHKIGITTKAYFDGGKSGQVQVDEAKLRQALTENPEAVINLLFSNSTDSYTSSSIDEDTKEQKKNSMGIVGRIYNEMAIGMKSIINKAGYGNEENTLRNIGVGSSIFLDYVINGSKSLLEKNLDDLNNKIYDEQERLNDYEDSCYSKFAALEKALSQMNSQASWIFQQFGS